MLLEILTDERIIQFATWVIITLLGIISYLLLNWINTNKKNNEDKMQAIFNQFVELRNADVKRFEDYTIRQDRVYTELKTEMHDFNKWIKDYIERMNEQEDWQTKKLENHETRINELEE